MPSTNDVFSYLDDLRESGVTNMFGAASYVEKKFRVDNHLASRYLLEWMRTFSREKSLEERVVESTL